MCVGCVFTEVELRKWFEITSRVQALEVPSPADVAANLKSDFICGEQSTGLSNGPE